MLRIRRTPLKAPIRRLPTDTKSLPALRLVRAVALGLALVLGCVASGPARVDAAVQTVRLAPTPFSPNGDGVKDATKFTWRLLNDAPRVDVLVERSDLGAVPVTFRSFELGARTAGLDSILWDGLDSLTAVVVDTVYTMRVREFDSAGAIVASAVLSARVDTHPPSVPVLAQLVDTLVFKPAFTFAGTVSGADSVIMLRGGVPVDTAAVSGTPPAFSFPIVLVEGDNVLAAQAYDRASNVSPLSEARTIRYVNTADILGLRVLPSHFSPNADGKADTSKVGFRLDAPTTRLEVYVAQAVGSGSAAVPDTLPYRRFIDAAAVADTFIVAWDGLDSTLAAAAPNGEYFFVVAAESIDADGAAVAATPRRARVTLDTAPPGQPVFNPLPATTTRSTIVVSGSATGADSTYLYRNSALIARLPGTFSFNAVLQLGNNSFTAQAFDLAQNASLTGGPVSTVYSEPIGFHAPERFRPNDTFDVNLNNTARRVDIRLYTLDGRPVRTLSSSVSTRFYEIEWNLKDDNGKVLGNGPYLAQLTVTYIDGSSAQQTAAVVVVR